MAKFKPKNYRALKYEDIAYSAFLQTMKEMEIRAMRWNEIQNGEGFWKKHMGSMEYFKW